MDAGRVVARIGWRKVVAGVVLLLAAEFAAVLFMQTRSDQEWQRCYAARSEPVTREACPPARQGAERPN
jgi:hypothetical protein